MAVSEQQLLGASPDKDYAGSVRQIAPILGEAIQLDGVYLFTSFDLVNSTAYKERSPNLWRTQVRLFYDNAWSEFRDKVRDKGHRTTELWKHLGDEVVFSSRVASGDQLFQLTEAARRAVRTLADLMEQQTSGYLSVKGTTWIGDCCYRAPEAFRAEAPQEDGPPNLLFPVNRGGEPAYDFIGPDIDAGFRLGGIAAKKLLVVSAELAWLLAEQSQHCAGNLRVIRYSRLKGVWENKPYPVVLYDAEWDALGDRFTYIDQEDSETIRHAINHVKGAGDLKKIFQQAGREPRVRALLDALHSAKAPDGSVAQATSVDELEVHCVGVCFDDSGRVLIARRPPDKKVAPAHWEFGCARLRPGQSFEDAIRSDYRGDFQLELETVNPSVPVGAYSIEKGGRKVPGVIMVMHALNPEDAKLNQKHTEFRWLKPDEAAEFAANNQCIHRFVDVLADARKVWELAGHS